MPKKPSPYNQALHTLQELKHSHPNYRLSQHIATAFADYGNIWGISDEEILFALEKYKTELEYNIAPDQEVERIIEEGKNLTLLFDQDEEEGDSYD